MKKIFFILTVFSTLTFWWCWLFKSTVTSLSVANIISSGDSKGSLDTITVVWPTWFIFSSTNCTSPTQCTEMTWEQTGYFKTYTSPDLGITFSVYSYGSAMSDSGYLVIIRSGNAVSLLPTQDVSDIQSIWFHPFPWEWIQMFEKLSNETLEQAIKRVANIINSWDCSVLSAAKISLDDSVYTSGYKAFIIDHPVSENIQKYCGDQELCYPSTFCGHYALGGSVVFFVGNENKNKFYFIDGGQDVLRWLWGKAWYQELQFLE